MTENNTSEIEKRIELLFFNPLKSRDEYIEKFTRYYPNNTHYAYSPLYDLQAQIVELDRKEMWFPVVLLLNILVEGVAANILTTNKVVEGVNIFYERYTTLTKLENVLLREYRNAREHNFSQFIGRLKQEPRKINQFNILHESLPETEKSFRKDNTYFKMAFSASLGGKKVADYQYGHYDEEKDYYLISPHVNPMSFRATVFSAVEKLKKDVEIDDKLQRNIISNLKVDNWTHIIYSAAESSDGTLYFDAPFLQ